MTHRRPTPWLALTLFLVAAHGICAQPLADRLPASTMVYLGWSPSASLLTTSTARMLADERVLAPWRRLFQEEILGFADRPEDGGERIGDHLPLLLMNAAQAEGCFALLELRPAKGAGRLSPQSVLMLDLGAKRRAFEEHFKPIQKRMKDRLGDRLQMMKLDKSWVFFKPDRQGKPRVTWGFVGDVFVMFFGDGAEEFIPKLVKGKIDQPLSTAPAFTDTVGKVPGERAVFTTYLDTKAASTLARTLLNRDAGGDLAQILGNWDKLLEEFGLGGVKGVAEKTVIEDKQFVTRTLVRLDGPPKGLLQLAATPAVDDAMLKVVPADAMAVGAARLDLAKLYDQIKASAITVAGNDAKEGFGQIEQGAEAMGLPVKDLLGPIGDQWVLYNAQSNGGFALTGWTLVGTIRDGEKFGKALRAVRTLVTQGAGERGVRIRTTQVDGATIEFLEAGRFDLPFPIAWAVVGDKFVVALYPQLVEDAIQHLAKPEKTILDNPAFAATRQRAGATGPLVYLSGPDVVSNLYPIGLVFVQFMTAMGGFDNDENGSDVSPADLIPSMKRLTGYVGHDALSIKTTPDGLLKTRTVGNPLLSPLAWVDSPILWLALGIPGMQASDEAADQTKSMSNLRQIGTSMLMHASDNKGAFPADLAALKKAQELNDELFKSPFGPAKEGPDYVYLHFAGLSNKVGAEIMIAFDAAALEQADGTAVLFGDGHVEWMTPDAFRAGLAESKKKAALQNAAP